MTPEIRLANAIVASLNAASFAMPFTAERVYIPIVDVQEAQAVKVLVAPRSESREFASRDTDYEDYVIDIGVLQHVAGVNDLVKLDALAALTDEIKTHLRRRRMADHAWVGDTSTRMLDKLEQAGQWAAIISVTYRGRR